MKPKYKHAYYSHWGDRPEFPKKEDSSTPMRACWSCSPRQVKSITLFSSCSPSLLPACLPSVMAQRGASINLGKLESTSSITRVCFNLVGVASANKIL